MITNDSFNYALFDERETVLLGCVGTAVAADVTQTILRTLTRNIRKVSG